MNQTFYLTSEFSLVVWKLVTRSIANEAISNQVNAF